VNFPGDAELITMDQYVKQVNVNQLGVVRVTKAFLPGIRQRQGDSLLSNLMLRCQMSVYVSVHPPSTSLVLM